MAKLNELAKMIDHSYDTILEDARKRFGD